MSLSQDRADQKATELAEIAARVLKRLGVESSDRVATEVIRNFVTVTPPEQPRVELRAIVMDMGGREGGVSTKPGNILLSMRKLVTILAGGVLTIATSLEAPWIAVLAALVVWDSVWSGLQVELTEREAAIIWTMWLNRDGENTIPDSSLLALVNGELSKYGRASLSHQQLADSLDRLKKIGCIKKSIKDCSCWWLQEWVSIDYR